MTRGLMLMTSLISRSRVVTCLFLKTDDKTPRPDASRLISPFNVKMNATAAESLVIMAPPLLPDFNMFTDENLKINNIPVLVMMFLMMLFSMISKTLIHYKKYQLHLNQQMAQQNDDFQALNIRRRPSQNFSVE